MKEGVRTIEEILIEIGKEEGMSLSEMKDIWKHQRDYVNKQMDTEGVYAIFLPYIGTLSLNIKQYTKEVRGKTKSIYQDFINKANSLVKHENYQQFSNSHKRITGVNRLARYIIKNYHTGIERSKRIIVSSKCWEIIEKYSNSSFEKRKEKLTRKSNEQIKGNN